MWRVTIICAAPNSEVYLNEPANSNFPQDVKIVQFSPANAQAGEERLQRIEEKMANMALTAQMPAHGGQITATEDILDHTDETSALASLALSADREIGAAIKDALRFENGLSESEIEKVKVTINKSFGLTLVQTNTIRELRLAREAGEIGFSAYAEELKRLGVLSADFDTSQLGNRTGGDA